MRKASKISSNRIVSGKKSPSFTRLRSSSAEASRHLAAIKSTSKAECLLRSTLWRRGLRFRKNVNTLPGKPDIVFSKEHLAVFCDGDFWHGRNWRRSKKRLLVGPNAEYWVAKILRNKQRDRTNQKLLEKMGWRVLRFWETDILLDHHKIADSILEHLPR